MKFYTMKMMTAAMLMSLFAFTAHANQNDVGMDTMEKAAMKNEMKDETTMMDMDKSKEMSQKMGDGEMAEQMGKSMKTMKDTMKPGMDGTKKMK